MAEAKQWKELSQNLALFWGRVVGEPQFVGSGESECAWINLETNVRELAANGQWVDSQQIVPLLVTDTNKVGVVKKYVKAGRELKITSYYKAWEHNGTKYHGLAVMTLELGRTPFKGKDDQAGAFPPPAGG
jgi:hypothetical protein